jgi:hypothetical protein
MIAHYWSRLLTWLHRYESRDHRIAREMRGRLLYPPRSTYNQAEAWRR